jgi:hypothetical protein
LLNNNYKHLKSVIKNDSDTSDRNVFIFLRGWQPLFPILYPAHIDNRSVHGTLLDKARGIQFISWWHWDVNPRDIAATQPPAVVTVVTLVTVVGGCGGGEQWL